MPTPHADIQFFATCFICLLVQAVGVPIGEAATYQLAWHKRRPKLKIDKETPPTPTSKLRFHMESILVCQSGDCQGWSPARSGALPGLEPCQGWSPARGGDLPGLEPCQGWSPATPRLSGATLGAQWAPFNKREKRVSNGAWRKAKQVSLLKNKKKNCKLTFISSGSGWSP